jgi:hypothetical protein
MGALAFLSWIGKSEGQDWLGGKVEVLGSEQLAEGSISLGNIQTDLYSRLELEDLEILDAAGVPILGVDRLILQLDPVRLWEREVWISRIEVYGPTMDLVVDEHGSLNILEILPPTDEEDSALSRFMKDWSLQIDRLEISQARVSYQDRQPAAAVPELSFFMDHLDLGFEQGSDGLHLDGLDLDLQLESPIKEDIALKGALSYDGSTLGMDYLDLGLSDLELQLKGEIARAATRPHLDLVLSSLSLGPVLPAEIMGEEVLSEPVDLSGRIEGPLSDLHLVLSAHLPKGELDVDFLADLESEETSWTLGLGSRGVDFSAATPLIPLAAELTADLSAEGTGLDPSTDMEASWNLQSGPIQIEGEEIESLRAQGRLVDGSVWIDSSNLQHLFGSANIRGSLELETLELNADAEVQVPSLAVLPQIEGLAKVQGAVIFRSQLTSVLGSEELSARISGELGVQELLVDEIAVRSLTLPMEGSVAMNSLALTGSILAEGIYRDQLEADLLRASKWSVDWSQEDGLHLDSSLLLSGVSLGDDAIRIGIVEGEMGGSLDSDSRLQLEANLDVQEVEMGPAGYRAEGGAVHAELNGDRVILDFNLARRARPFLKGEILGDLFRQEWVVDRLIVAPRSDRPLMSERPVEFRLADGGVRDLDLALRGDAGSIEVQGDMLEIHSGQSDLHVQIKELDLSYVLDVIGLYDPDLVDFVDPGKVQGLFNMSGMARDGEEGMVIGGKGHIEDLVWEELAQIPLLEFQVDGPLVRPRIEVGISDEAGPIFEIDGTVPLKGGVASLRLDCTQEVDLDGVLSLSEHERIKAVVPLVEAPDGLLAAKLEINGQACDPDLELLASGELRLGRDLSNLRYDFDLAREGSKVDIYATLEEGLAQRVELNGELQTGLSSVLGWVLEGEEEPDLKAVETWVSDLAIGVIPLDLPLSTLARYVPVPRGVHGRVAGGLSIVGDPMAPQINAGLLLIEGRVGASNVTMASVGVMPEADGYRVALMLLTEDSGGLDVQGFVPISIDLSRGADQDLTKDGLDLKVSGAGLPLDMMVGVVDDVIEADGTLLIEGEVAGSLLEPSPRLEIRTEDASLAYSVTGVRYPRVDLWARLVKDHFFLHSLEIDSEPLWSRFQSRSGTAAIEGQATLDGLALDQVRMNMLADGFWLSNIPMASLQVDGEIEITGRTPGLVFRGTGKLIDGRMNFDESWFTEQQDLVLDSSIKLNRSTEETGERFREKVHKDFWEPFDVEVEVDLDRKLRMVAHIPMEYAMGRQLAALSTVSADVELDGQNLKVFWRDGEPNMVGTVEVFDGSMYMLGRQFKVGAGEVSWVGGDFLDPILDLQASKGTRGYGDVTTRVGGSLEQMTVSFDSEDYPDQTDILSILMLGKPASELAGSEGQVGAQMLGAALAMAAGRQFSRAVGSSFMGQVELDQDALKVGFPLGEKLFLELQRRSLAEADENVRELRLEWLIMQRMYFEFVSGDRGQGSADLYRRWRF